MNGERSRGLTLYFLNVLLSGVALVSLLALVFVRSFAADSQQLTQTSHVIAESNTINGIAFYNSDNASIGAFTLAAGAAAHFTAVIDITSPNGNSFLLSQSSIEIRSVAAEACQNTVERVTGAVHPCILVPLSGATVAQPDPVHDPAHFTITSAVFDIYYNQTAGPYYVNATVRDSLNANPAVKNDVNPTMTVPTMRAMGLDQYTTSINYGVSTNNVTVVAGAGFPFYNAGNIESDAIVFQDTNWSLPPNSEINEPTITRFDGSTTNSMTGFNYETATPLDTFAHNSHRVVMPASTFVPDQTHTAPLAYYIRTGVKFHGVKTGDATNTLTLQSAVPAP